MQTVEIVVIEPVSDEVLDRIAAVDTRVRVTDARGWFDREIRETWPQWTVERYLGTRAIPESTRQDRDRVLAWAEVILGGWPYPLDLRARAPRLRWFHQLPAGASNLRRGDLWGGDVMVTTSRGYGNTEAMAEYVLASFFHFAKGFHRANLDQTRHHFDHGAYRPLALRGKTVCVVGAGGIGREVARLCAAVGLRVIGTRRHKQPDTELPPGFTRLEGPDFLLELLGESDFVAVCCQWSPETTKLIGREVFGVMRPGTVLVNVARGEIIDEAALIDALAAGTLRGIALDVYVGETEHEPDRRLWDDERVIITPHISAATDRARNRRVEVFCENLHAYLDGRPLMNVIDWERGY
jgi:phosphoglycerate dehydrogenase-like enzyme